MLESLNYVLEIANCYDFKYGWQEYPEQIGNLADEMPRISLRRFCHHKLRLRTLNRVRNKWLRDSGSHALRQTVFHILCTSSIGSNRRLTVARLWVGFDHTVFPTV